MRSSFLRPIVPTYDHIVIRIGAGAAVLLIVFSHERGRGGLARSVSLVKTVQQFLIPYSCLAGKRNRPL